MLDLLSFDSVTKFIIEILSIDVDSFRPNKPNN